VSLKDEFMNQFEYSGRDNLEIMREAKNYNRFLLDLVLAQASTKELVVDFGAGGGTFSLPVAAESFRLICVETDPVLSSRLLGNGLKVISSLELIEDGSVDYLYTLNVLEHIEDDDVIVKLWMQKLRPGGRIFVYVPAFEALFSSMDFKVGHFRRYTKQTLNAKLKKAGFQVVEAKYADSIGYFATLIFKAFDNGEGSVNVHMLKFYDRWIFPLSRIVDLIASPFLGKNVYAYAIKKLQS
jgi:2-polyprenyl-3-methyl-5-hydroxy-6-metoxy-1,4-benzoquinol methylase